MCIHCEQSIDGLPSNKELGLISYLNDFGPWTKIKYKKYKDICDLYKKSMKSKAGRKAFKKALEIK